MRLVKCEGTDVSEAKVVYFDRTPFSVILLSALETYPKECTGLLFGYENPDPEKATFEVWSAIPHQIVYHRSEEEVKEDFKSYLRLVAAQRMITGDVLLGGFHSHPNGRPLINKTDKKYLLEKRTHRIEVIVGIEPIDTQQEWGFSNNFKTIFGHVVLGDSIYGIELAAYWQERHRVRRLGLRSAYVEMMVYLHQYGIPYIYSFGDLIQRAKDLGKDYYRIRELLFELEQSIDDETTIKGIVHKIREELES